jgi:hypothetical protein
MPAPVAAPVPEFLPLAPVRAATVPAKAEVPHEGRFEDSGRADDVAGREERCVSE